jgi:alpha-tubulin suppressor-like RCC1 family protein
MHRAWRSIVAATPLSLAVLAGAHRPSAPSVTWAAVSVGDVHACALATDGAAYCWGGSRAPTTGTSALLRRPGARRFAARGGASAFKSIAVGKYTVCATTRSAYGSTLGNPTGYDRYCFMDNVHTCALTDAGEAYCGGMNRLGQLGNPSTLRDTRRVDGPLTFTSISAGSEHTCGVTTDDVGYCWGSNKYGQLGVGRPDTLAHARPAAVGRDVRAITAGSDATCALGTNGLAYCWGAFEDGAFGTTGRSYDIRPIEAPVRFETEARFTALSLGKRHACALDERGQAYCWGMNGYGQLGSRVQRGTTTITPTPVGGPRFSAITAGLSEHTCGLTPDGVAYCWGSNYRGQLGAGNDYPNACRSSVLPCADQPVRVAGGLRFKSLAAGNSFTCGVTVAGELYCWGDNRYGQLSDAKLDESPVPIRVGPQVS